MDKQRYIEFRKAEEMNDCFEQPIRALYEDKSRWVEDTYIAPEMIAWKGILDQLDLVRPAYSYIAYDGYLGGVHTLTAEWEFEGNTLWGPDMVRQRLKFEAPTKAEPGDYDKAAKWLLDRMADPTVLEIPVNSSKPILGIEPIRSGYFKKKYAFDAAEVDAKLRTKIEPITKLHVTQTACIAGDDSFRPVEFAGFYTNHQLELVAPELMETPKMDSGFKEYRDWCYWSSIDYDGELFSVDKAKLHIQMDQGTVGIYRDSYHKNLLDIFAFMETAAPLTPSL